MSANTSCNDSAAELLRQCVERESWDPHLARSLAAPACSDALFRILFEGLADRFEPQLCDNYAAIFAFILNQPDLIERYRRIRQPRLCTLDPNRVVVLSRVTLGADIAITSVILDAVRQRFPNARITFAGSAKAAELFHGMQAVDHVDIPYARQGSISDRLASLHHLREQFDREDTIVIDPDSRLTQLGLLPVNDESRYFFFESRAYGRERSANLTELTQQWVLEALGVTQATNRIYPPVADTQQWGRYAAVSLGTANNPAKQLPPDIESALIRLLSDRFDNVIVDRGFGPEESARVDHAIAGSISGTRAIPWSGSFARFASVIRNSACYVGYDSAGQHAAASFGTPLITLFKGFVNERMFARWQPSGPGPKRILKITDSISLPELTAALDSFSSSTAPESA